MTSGLLKQGTKYALTAVFLALATAVMVASYVLALREKLSQEWVNLASIYLPMISLATVGYQASRAYTDGKSIDAGAPTGRADP